eukprot:gnl/TRDRNA2_/TRDRNA2_77243_c0_seq1.p1 gnl/TRDRNA2_/TRDRNA2_77243_c0~~gnl/TRDRNA2_/TRDRNA2_77243_c0_seq1.p1  ORF type:complete len:144 (-),score=18.29 gnl/TRDRNA2_/TRDRNA2_77243_c0_seq1:81-512(-)
MQEQCIHAFSVQDLGMSCWASSRQGTLKYAWSFFDQSKLAKGRPSLMFTFDALLMECEQRTLLRHGIAHLKALESAVGNLQTEFGFSVATKCVGAMYLAKTTGIKATKSQLVSAVAGSHHQTANATLGCMWCAAEPTTVAIHD